MNTVCIYVNTKTHGLDVCSYISLQSQVCLIISGRLVDTRLGSNDCKLNTIEGSHCSTTKNKIYLKWFFFLVFFFFFVFFFFNLGFVMYNIAVR